MARVWLNQLWHNALQNQAPIAARDMESPLLVFGLRTECRPDVPKRRDEFAQLVGQLRAQFALVAERQEHREGCQEPSPYLS